ncbi:hypothetical protein [Haloplanus halobius]|uniref:hypothetical protein n=1 Tax=Haloplanus halobius TaxID=2934938 RepID=UPI00200BCDBB|nr:hypothetical protein [Haloplanus sp. XH21]
MGEVSEADDTQDKKRAGDEEQHRLVIDIHRRCEPSNPSIWRQEQSTRERGEDCDPSEDGRYDAKDRDDPSHEDCLLRE